MASIFKLFCVLLLLPTPLICSEKKILAVYWGQNSVSRSGKSEPSLEYFCSKQRYNIIILSFLNDFVSVSGGGMPSLNFANHCGSSIGGHPGLLRCEHIVNAIGKCKSNGIKVLLSLGGAIGNYGFYDEGKPTPGDFAKTIWNMFLNGHESDRLRPFRHNILDGIDLDIENSKHEGYADFIIALRGYMDSDTERTYLITGAPQCPFPDRSLGPDGIGFEGTALQQVPHLFDYLFVQYYNNYCHSGNIETFLDNFNHWSQLANKANSHEHSEKPLKIVVGLPGGPRATINQIYFRTVEEVEHIYERIYGDANFGGFMLWDAGWENSLVTNAKTYGEHLGAILMEESEVEATTKPMFTDEEIATYEPTTEPVVTTMEVMTEEPTTTMKVVTEEPTTTMNVMTEEPTTTMKVVTEEPTTAKKSATEEKYIEKPTTEGRTLEQTTTTTSENLIANTIKPVNLKDHCNEMQRLNPTQFLFPHPWLCDKFMICFHRTFEMSCPAGLHWDQLHFICNYKAAANCPYK